MLHNGYKEILMNMIMVDLTGWHFWINLRFFPPLGEFSSL